MNIGYEFQDEIKSMIEENDIADNVKISKGSGSKHGDSDIIVNMKDGSRIIIECKYKDKYKHRSEIRKLLMQKYKRGGIDAIGVLITKGRSGDIKVEMDINDFIELLKCIK